MSAYEVTPGTMADLKSGDLFRFPGSPTCYVYLGFGRFTYFSESVFKQQKPEERLVERIKIVGQIP